MLVHEQGLRIKDVYLDKSLDLLLLVLNNGQVVRSNISDHDRLRGASEPQLAKWELIAGGTGLSWPKLDEDLSLRGFIQAASVRNVIRSLAGPGPKVARSSKRQARKA
ncbi:MAG: DUF2442 domain-containing protein [Bacteroidetes bacterium]|nr:DUF2442 domain-containing protein [Bacteroidota bacterium]MBS1940913.1 DUF2442 domain-containing protein [Bacteroidota bacterium]